MNGEGINFFRFSGKQIGLTALMFSAGIALTIVLWHAARQHELDEAQRQFDQRARDIQAAIIDRLEAHEQILVGAAGLFASIPAVGRIQWKSYVDAQNISRRYPGTQGVGFAVYLRPLELAEHEHAVRSEGFPEYAVHPGGDRGEYTAIQFLEPFDERNRKAFGYDMFSEPVRRAAMAMARDTGKVALSGKVTLLQENDREKQAGFLMYVPVYRKGFPVETAVQRRAALRGYAYSPFRASDLMRAVFGDRQRDQSFELHAGENPEPATLLYQSESAVAGGGAAF